MEDTDWIHVAQDADKWWVEIFTLLGSQTAQILVSPDVSEQVIGPILKGQAGTDRLRRNVDKQLRTNAA